MSFPTIDGHNSTNFIGFSGNISLTTTQPGDTIYVVAAISSGSVTSVSSPNTTGWGRRKSQTLGTPNLEVWTGTAAAALTSESIHIATGPDDAYAVVAFGVTGNIGFDPAAPTANSGSSSAPNGSLTTTDGNDLLLVFEGTAASPDVSPPTGWSFLASAFNSTLATGAAVFYMDAASAGANSISLSGSQTHWALIFDAVTGTLPARNINGSSTMDPFTQTTTLAALDAITVNTAMAPFTQTAALNALDDINGSSTVDAFPQTVTLTYGDRINGSSTVDPFPQTATLTYWDRIDGSNTIDPFPQTATLTYWDRITVDQTIAPFDQDAELIIPGLKSTKIVNYAVFGGGPLSSSKLVGYNVLGQIEMQATKLVSYAVLYPLIRLVGVEASAEISEIAIVDVIPSFTGVEATAQVATFTSGSGIIVPQDRTFFIAGIQQQIIPPGIVLLPTSEDHPLPAGNYIIASSQSYTIGQVHWNGQVKVEGVDWEYYAPAKHPTLKHIVHILTPGTVSTAITLIFYKWDIGVRAGFKVNAWPVPFGFSGTSIIAERSPPINQFFTIEYTVTRAVNNPRSMFAIFPNMVDDMLIDHLLYDGQNGFQTFRPVGYKVFDTSDKNVWEWNGTDWISLGPYSDGSHFYVKRLRQVIQVTGLTLTVAYTAGDGASSLVEVISDSPPRVYPPFGESIAYNLLEDAFAPDAATRWPSAYQVAQHPGDYDPWVPDIDS